MKVWIYRDPFYPFQMQDQKTSEGMPYDDVRMRAVHNALQEADGLIGIEREVGSDDFGGTKELAQHSSHLVSAGGCESVCK